MKRLFLLFCFAILTGWMPHGRVGAPSFAHTYYVCPTGSDSNDGLSPSNPWQTLNKVASTSFLPSTAILLCGSSPFTVTSPANVSNNQAAAIITAANASGSVGNPIVIDSYSGNATINDNGIGITILVKAPYFQVTNVTLSSTTATRGIMYYDSTLTNTTYSGGVISGVTCLGYIDHCLQVSARSSVSFRWDGFQFLNNTVDGSSSNALNAGIFVNDASGAIGAGITNCIVRGNIVHDVTGQKNGTAGASGNAIIIAQPNGCLLEYNLTYNSGQNTNTCGGPSGQFIYKGVGVTIQFGESYGFSPPIYNVSSQSWNAGTYVSASQSPGAGAILIDGTLASGGVATFTAAQRVFITSGGNDSGITFTVNGTDVGGGSINSSFAGANAGTAQTGIATFKTVTSITANSSVAGTLIAGTGRATINFGSPTNFVAGDAISTFGGTPSTWNRGWFVVSGSTSTSILSDLNSNPGTSTLVGKAANSGTTTHGACDWDGFDLDDGTSNSIVQYSYAHDNYGLSFLMWWGNATSALWHDNTFRWNIAETYQYGGALPSTCFGFTGSASPVVNVYLHNNTCYARGVLSNAMGGGGAGAQVAGPIAANNIFVSEGGQFFYMPFQSTATGLSFIGNDYYNAVSTFSIRWGGVNYTSLAAWQATGQETVSAVPVGTVTNPLLVVGGAGGTCSWTPSALAGPQPCPANYKLQVGSPMKGIGLTPAQTSIPSFGSRDYFGNAVPNATGSGYNIGADNSP